MADTCVKRAACFAKRGEPHDLFRAVGDAQRALALAPAHRRALERLGTSLAQLGEPERSVAAFDRLLTLVRGDDAARALATRVERRRAAALDAAAREPLDELVAATLRDCDSDDE